MNGTWSDSYTSSRTERCEGYNIILVLCCQPACSSHTARTLDAINRSPVTFFIWCHFPHFCHLFWQLIGNRATLAWNRPASACIRFCHFISGPIRIASSTMKAWEESKCFHGLTCPLSQVIFSWLRKNKVAQTEMNFIKMARGCFKGTRLLHLQLRGGSPYCISICPLSFHLQILFQTTIGLSLVKFRGKLIPRSSSYVQICP